MMIATDLDGTVVYSPTALAHAADLTPPGPATPQVPTPRPSAGGPMVKPSAEGPMVNVESGDLVAYMGAPAARDWARLAARGLVVPVTTRSRRQYQRLRLPGRPAVHAIVCNGAQLLRDGQPDPDWERQVRIEISGSAEPFATVHAQAVAWHTEHGLARVWAVEEIFTYLTVTQRDAWPVGFAEHARDWAAERGWRTSHQGRKLYFLPAVLDKATAVARLAERLGVSRLVAGGDSLLDAELLRHADFAIRPAHGELHRAGFTATNCRITAASGLLAGDEILKWYTEQADQERGPTSGP